LRICAVNNLRNVSKSELILAAALAGTGDGVEAEDVVVLIIGKPF
jgi:hypothetical protein